MSSTILTLVPPAGQTTAQNATPCPTWCTGHDHDVDLHSADVIRTTYVNPSPDITAARDESFHLDLGDDGQPVITIVTNGEPHTYSAAAAAEHAQALLGQLAKAGIR